MTKRHCFVAQVGDAIEALASALDPEREPPFKGDILDLLEWAAKDVLEMNQRLEQAHADIAGLHDQLDEPQIAQDDYRLNKIELEESRQQVTLLRDAMEAAWHDGYAFCGAEGLTDAQKQFKAVFAATEPKP